MFESNSTTREWRRPCLTKSQKQELKKLHKKNNRHGFLAISEDIWFIASAMFLFLGIHIGFLPLSLIIIGARQRALATLLHETAHGILFKSPRLNRIIGKYILAPIIFQSFLRYKKSHVYCHHPFIGDKKQDPDYSYMLSEKAYQKANYKSVYINLVIKPLLGYKLLPYFKTIVTNRLFPLQKEANKSSYADLIMMLFVHLLILISSFVFIDYTDKIFKACLLWYFSLFFIHPIIGWFIELSEHYPMMSYKTKSEIYFSRNRYAGAIETFLFSIHKENYHLTHHLYPSIPFWNLKKATAILREDADFCKWDNYWGGI
ncbi:MAG: fatty acid desaturase [Alphaproteobacteria bacterium]